MAAENCAVQMRAAVDDFMAWRHEFPQTLMQAAQRHFVEMIRK